MRFNSFDSAKFCPSSTRRVPSRAKSGATFPELGAAAAKLCYTRLALTLSEFDCFGGGVLLTHPARQAAVLADHGGGALILQLGRILSVAAGQRDLFVEAVSPLNSWDTDARGHQERKRPSAE